MKHTVLKLNKMPEDKQRPAGLSDGDLIILLTPSESVVMDTISRADAVEWSGYTWGDTPRATHFAVIQS